MDFLKQALRHLRLAQKNETVGTRGTNYFTHKINELQRRPPCGFRGKAVTIPKSSRAAFRNDAGHDSGMKPVTDSDFKPVTSGSRSEP